MSNELIAELRSAAATLRTPHPSYAHEQKITAELLERAARVLADHANSEPNLNRQAVPSKPGTYRLSCAETGHRSLVVHVRRNEADVLMATAAGLGTETVTAMHRKLSQVHWEVVDVHA
ncbi:hypothetical protein [Xanthomonas citri]|uniref:hypothetical protein n=1 Tax=Xanthomonas citri TaxID=346 RepID=UPI0003111B91|nr:hypothetical protein [Xanthomonas citri]AMV00085.1 hypothetical protein TP37_19900 [Xanthomonas citri pv. aurantifolii]AMV02090.1 hypothetical protein TP50_06230 [Xanthomonas citri pv. aurantifolii]MCC8490864.1 hypothetical protein [Xanthomonas citri pv. fuscans]TBW97976.1 hypothetical protein TP47_09640 [Xanthomonas citri pv. aurantifolii]TBW99292.1 hypothetical protein TP49_04500 [Xanthomonas citri pv. aurantifolii]